MEQIVPRGPFSLRAAAEFGFGPNEGRAPTRSTARCGWRSRSTAARGYAGAVLRQAKPRTGRSTSSCRRAGGASPRTRRCGRSLGSSRSTTTARSSCGRRARPGDRRAPAPAPRPATGALPLALRGGRLGDHLRPPPGPPGRRGAHGDREPATARPSRTSPAATLHAFPQPERLAELPDDTPGLNAEKVARLRGVARAALEGQLDVDHLQRARARARNRGGPAAEGNRSVLRRTRRGPRRAASPTRCFRPPSRKLLKRAGELYGLAEPLTLEQLTRRAEPWRPFRTWTTVLIRLAGDRARARCAELAGLGGGAAPRARACSRAASP